MRLGTTRGTNALITRRGAERRLRHHARLWRHPARSATRTGRGCSSWPSASRRRCLPRWSRSTSGSPPTAACSQRPTRATDPRQLRRLRPSGIESLAICLLHAFAIAEHEQIGRADRPRGRLRRDQPLEPRGAADQDRLPRRHDGDRRLSESDPAAPTSRSLRTALGERPAADR